MKQSRDRDHYTQVCGLVFAFRYNARYYVDELLEYGGVCVFFLFYLRMSMVKKIHLSEDETSLE